MKPPPPLHSRAVAAALLAWSVAWAMPAGAQQGGDAPATPAFDCRQAEKVVEHWICASQALMQADQALAEQYRIAQAKPDGDAALATLRADQLRWLRQRNRCDTPGCVAAAYAQRTAALNAANGRVLVLQSSGAAPVFARTLPLVNDTRVVGGIALRRSVATAFQLELTIDPADARPWRKGGPGARVACWPPDHREGYAARFQYAAFSWGDAFRPMVRDGNPGYVLMRWVIGKDLPLNEDIRCTVALTEWLLEQPSQLRLVEVQP